MTYSTESDGTTEEHNGEECWDPSSSSHPTHTNEDDDAEDVLNAGQINTCQNSQICFGSDRGLILAISGLIGLYYRLNCIVIVGQTGQQGRHSSVLVLTEQKHLIPFVRVVLICNEDK